MKIYEDASGIIPTTALTQKEGRTQKTLLPRHLLWVIGMITEFESREATLDMIYKYAERFCKRRNIRQPSNDEINSIIYRLSCENKIRRKIRGYTVVDMNDIHLLPRGERV